MNPRVTLVTTLSAADGRLQKPVTNVEPALGVLTLASLVRERYPIQVVDLNHAWVNAEGCRERFSEALESICSRNPGVVGFSSISGSFPLTIRLAEQVARELPGVRILLGGPQASVVDVETLRAFPFIDIVVRGEADETFPALLDAITADEPLHRIPGVTWRYRGKITRNLNAPVILDLDRLPLPAFDLYSEIENSPTLPVEAGRGCPFACRFCSTNDFFRRRFRLKSAACLVGQMQQLHARYPRISNFELVHDMFTVDRRKVVAFCEELIAIGSPFVWSCSARTDCVDAELFEKMKAAGCEGVFFGIETGSQRLQKVIDKNLDLAESRRVLGDANSVGLRATASLIAGYPQETHEDFRETVAFFGDTLQYPYVDHQFHILSPLAETPITTEYKQQLYLEENWTRNSENGLEQGPEDRQLIEAHPDIFPNFYAFPCALDRTTVRHICDFLHYGSLRVNAILLALRLLDGDLLNVAERFDRMYGLHPTSYFLQGSSFPYDAAAFAEHEYGQHQDPGLTVACRFYRALADVTGKARPDCPPFDRARVSLHPNAHIVTIEGDFLAVVESLRQGVRAPDSVLGGPSTLVVREENALHVHISEMPPLALSILKHAAVYATVDEVVADFRRRQIHIAGLPPETVAERSIDYLVNSGFLKFTTESQIELSPVV